MRLMYNVTLSLSMDAVRRVKKNPRLTKRQRRLIRIVFGV